MFESIKNWFANFGKKLDAAKDKIADEKAGKTEEVQPTAVVTPIVPSPTQVSEPVHDVLQTPMAHEVVVDQVKANEVVVDEVVVEKAPARIPAKKPAAKPAAKKAPTKSTTPARKAPAKSTTRKTNKK